MSLTPTLALLVGQAVVVDVAPPVVYIGTLTEAADAFVVLENADVHPLWNSTTSKELYVMEVRRNGVQPTRKKVWLKMAEILSVSRLEDVILF